MKSASHNPLPRHHGRFVSLWVALMLLLASGLGGGVFGQSADEQAQPPQTANTLTPSQGKDPGQSTSGTDAETALNEALSARVRDLIRRFIPEQEFYVTVKTTPVPTFSADLPYVPKAQTAAFFRKMPGAELQKIVQDMSIVIFLNKIFGEPTKKSIKTLLEENLGISKPGVIQFEGLSIESPRDSAVQRALERTEADLRQARSEAKKLERERNDIKNELQLTKSRLEGNKTEGAPKPQAKGEKGPDSLLALLPWICLAAALMVILLIASKVFAGSIKTVGTGITLVAGALENVGGALKVKTDGDGAAPPPDGEKSKGEPEAGQAQAVAGGASGGGAGIELYDRIEKLNQELLQALNEKTEGMTLKRVTTLLSRPETVAKGVASMELLGKDKANELFQKLNRSGREAVLLFLENGNYGRPKAELMLEAGEELKTQLLGESFGNMRGELSVKLAEVMLQLTAGDLTALAAKLEKDLLPRFFVYLESKDLAYVLSELDKRQEGGADPVIDVLPKMAEVESDTSHDERIVAAIREHIESRSADKQSKYLPFYQQVIESLDGGLADRAVERISAANPSLRAPLSIYVVTFKTFFKLPEEARKDLIETFSNKEIAALSFGTEESLRGEIMGCVAKRRHSLIEDEVEILGTMNPKDAAQAFDDAKDQLIAEMKKMRASGRLQAYLKEANEEGEVSPEAA